MSNFVNPAVQAMDLIREIGDMVSQSGEPINQFPGKDDFSVQLIYELRNTGIIKIEHDVKAFEGTVFTGVNLTLRGWEQYEQEKRGKFKGG